MISIFASVGSAVTLGIACLVISFDFNWRIAFWFGAGIAFIGSSARTRLREIPGFADAKLQLQKILEKVKLDKKLLQNNIKMKTNKKTILSLFLIQCIWPVCFYIAYILCDNILKTHFEYSAADVIRQNFYVSMVYLLGLTFLTYLNYKIYPLKVLKVQLYMYFIFSLTSPYLLNHASSVTEIFIIQILTMLLRPDISSAIPIFFKHFPIFKRFRATSYIFA
ncbi:MAG: hypothetical protein O7C59_10635 [Rickettsia endosymbiont of Ixodes persulcatus]|nr:hypothetical protein [Rickettsia endosymbiont of Ixodes persulcatus]MCZ6901998.1 hypothetical protein [Rickettsia endosymbiont of Ixodes persulcatus]MCZ6903087.1 hypothetical protein [Rickettsia endosymbiont of Ixodes persulcatus]MCZ6908362.1 hypothetical protein [Rickettsia endosymbiont of Ixodes persulcatus]MCZ6910422.1 hypothetical protein [Rickettsia endosymbiont of Ixodes persulcatus]